jgi:hypothetical protein
VSVDTYLKRKNLGPYQPVDYDGVRVYVANSLARWAEAVHVDGKRGLLTRSFLVEATHKHGATCQH